MRRWQILAVEDNPEGSPEIEWLVPFVLARPHPGLGARDLHGIAIANILAPHLPRAVAEPEIEELEWTLNDPMVSTAERRDRVFSARHRWPILDVERTFSEAWTLLGERRKDPPDILLLDIDLGKGADEAGRLESIFRDIRSAGAILRAVNDFFSYKREDFLARGGLFLLARALQVFRDSLTRPLIVVYSASSEAPSYLHPLALAVEGQFQIVMKQDLKQDEEVRLWLYEQRVRHWIRSGLIRTDAVWQATSTLRSVLGNHRDGSFWEDVAPEWGLALREVLPLDVGGGWRFATLFAAQLPAVLRVPRSAADRQEESELTSTALAALRDIEGYLGESDFPRALGTFFETTPYPIFCHRASPSEFVSLPDPELVDRGWATSTKSGRWAVWCNTLRENGDSVPDVSYGRKLAGLIDRQYELLPAGLQELILHHFQLLAIPEKGDNPFVALTKSESPWDPAWESILQKVRQSFRHRNFPKESADLIHRWCMTELGKGSIKFISSSCDAWASLESVQAGVATGLRAGDIQIFLDPQERGGTGPLCGLIRAILGNLHHAYPSQATWPVAIGYLHDPRERQFKIIVEDQGCGFGLSLRAFDFLNQPSDLSVAVRRARGWCGIEIASGSIRRDPYSRECTEGHEEVAGTRFVLCISVHSL
jgi:hypothetical protein